MTATVARTRRERDRNQLVDARSSSVNRDVRSVAIRILRRNSCATHAATRFVAIPDCYSWRSRRRVTALCSDNVSDLWTFLRLVPVLSFMRGQRRTGRINSCRRLRCCAIHPSLTEPISMCWGVDARQRIRATAMMTLMVPITPARRDQQVGVGACAAGPLSVGQRFAETHYVKSRGGYASPP
jgi:hypothetical protein